ncbi:type IV secretory system conjugative DNA transfer family protein [Sporosarcina sp. resist]|uniref:VirD4-like conjugal transfer protein, CD1115 family n=1 Tax=Sporosarcina sp. resist TaxID=2762563 RepID=UPI00164D9001|nr:type IV secretory system conjugative DNA transfer family protein [Sporosarcina sp. resist]QNK89091.1 type IV secretory system conjugative DNA transfer family protein [Sporosarcina sp. resist]
MSNQKFLERLSEPKILVVFTLLYLLAMFFVANLLLAFLQAIISTVQQFSANADNATFSLDWRSVFVYQAALIGYYIGFYIVVGIGLVKFIFNMRMNFVDLNKGQHGTSEFEKVKELKKQYKIIPATKNEYDGDGGVIIAGLQEKWKPYQLMIDEGPIHTMLIGITRSGKGETWVIPMIDVLSRAKNKPSLVINDPKGELTASSYDKLIERGYEVHVFNLIQQHMGMGFNPLQLVVDAWKTGNTSLAQQYANSVAFSLYNDPNAKDPFWSNSAKSLVNAIILAMTEDAIAMGKEEKINMYSVANFLSTFGSDNDEETGDNALDLFFKARDENNPARMMYATSNFAAGNTRASIFSTAMDKLQIFTLEPNAKLTSYNSMKLTDIGFGEKPIVVFMVTPDFDSSNHVLASIFVSQLYRVNAEKATMSPSGKMNRHVHFLLDEFGNMPTIHGMAGMVTVGAGRGFRFHLIVQAYSQLKASYGDDSDTIIGNCSNQIYILTKDKATAEQYSALIGSRTITDVSRSGKLLSTDKSHNESVKERPLLMPDELMQLKEGQSVVVRANKRQDNKRRKIIPKPIFNRDVTSHKFRWEYLADDFDNSKSILSLPLMSTQYHDLNMTEMVFTSKSEKDQYQRMASVMGNEQFAKLFKALRKGIKTEDLIEKYNEDFQQWTFLHLLSYLTYETDAPINFIRSQVYSNIEQFMPDLVLREWMDKINMIRVVQREAALEELKNEQSVEEGVNEVDRLKKEIMEGDS